VGFDSPLGDKKKLEMSATKRHIKLLLLLAAGLLVACGPDVNPPQPETQDEIRLDVSIWQMMQGAPSRRVSTYDDQAALKAETAGFRCFIYNENDITSYNASEGSVVKWNSTQWQFQDGKHYWPASDALDFFCYMPATVPSYITNNSDVVSSVTYVAQNPQFKCKELPMTAAGQSSLKEFIYALTTDRTKAQDGASGVTLTFQHPFARIKLQLAASHPNININSITFKSIQNNGSYVHSGSTWTPLGDATDFELTFTGGAEVFDNNPVEPRQIGEYYIMIPQAWAGVIEVDADCLFWGDKKNYPNLTTTVPTDWEPGHSYTYTFNISPDDLIVNVNKFTEQW